MRGVLPSLALLLLGSASAEVPEEQVREAVRAHVGHRLSVDPRDVDVQWLGLGRPIRCPDGARIELDSPSGHAFQGRSDVLLVARAEGAECDRLRLRPRIDLWVQVPVAARPTPTGALVELATGRVRRSELSGPAVDPLAGPWLARAPLAAGEPVTLTHVRAAPDGRSGQRVELVAQRGGVRLITAGRLMADAGVGDPVEVINIATGVLVQGTLVAPGVVRAGGPR